MKTALEYRVELDETAARVQRISDPIFKNDLVKMIATAHTAITQLSTEEVVCRGRNSTTPAHQRLAANVEDIISNLEQHVVVAILSS